MEKEANVLERDHVHSVYEKIAPYFCDSRYKAWPKVQQFLLAQEPGSLIADIGCGNGKYLHINSQAFKLGCDYCFPLAESARNQGYEIMVCDGLCLPYRNECFDAVLSIAVIHHFSTKERRIRAIKEMARILRRGGQIMIYVWAMEQKRRKFEKQDIFVPWNPVPPSPSNTSHAFSKPMSQKHRKMAINQHSSSMDSTTEEQKKSASFVEEKETFYTSFEKSLRWRFSKSLDSVLDFGTNSCSSNCQHTNEQSIFHDYSIQLNKEKLIDQNEPATFTKPRQNSEDDALGVEMPLLPYHCSDLSSTGSENKSKHPTPGEVIRDCSRVSLPDLVSPPKGLPVKQLQNNSPPKPVKCENLNKSPTDISLQETDCGHGIPVWENQEEANPEGACLRYYHVFRKGELMEMIEHHIPELHVLQAYFDHANWCVVAEKVQVWKI